MFIADIWYGWCEWFWIGLSLLSFADCSVLSFFFCSFNKVITSDQNSSYAVYTETYTVVTECSLFW